MKRKLFGNMNRFIRLFCISMVAITLVILVVRLTLFKDMATLVTEDPVVVNNIVQEHGELFDYKYNSQIYFAKSAAKGDVLIENPSSNTCYMTVTILDPETQDSYLYTGFIEPGSIIDTAKLQMDLEDGVHNFVIRISAFDPQAPHTPLGNVEKPITLYVGVKPPSK